MNTLDSGGGALSARFLLISFLLHGLVAGLLWWGGPQLKREAPLQIRLVRLAGGGQNRPGWVSEAMQAAAPAEERPAAPEPEARLEPAPETKQEAAPRVARSPDPAPARPQTPPAEPERPRRESEQATATEGRPRGEGRSTSGGARDAGAGPRGAGGSRTGAMSDQPDLPGMGQYLLRLENAIQRAFTYPARSSGRRAVFHFRVDRRGQVLDLTQVVESGLPGLDLSGKSAITRAVLPPLPPAFPFDQIGVTFTFVDE
jgi:outer membrane biosynthesis protein TonB